MLNTARSVGVLDLCPLLLSKTQCTGHPAANAHGLRTRGEGQAWPLASGCFFSAGALLGRQASTHSPPEPTASGLCQRGHLASIYGLRTVCTFLGCMDVVLSLHGTGISVSSVEGGQKPFWLCIVCVCRSSLVESLMKLAFTLPPPALSSSQPMRTSCL